MGTILLKASLLSEVGNMKRQSSSARDTPDQHPCCPKPSQGCSCISEPLSHIQGLYRLKIGAPPPSLAAAGFHHLTELHPAFNPGSDRWKKSSQGTTLQLRSLLLDSLSGKIMRFTAASPLS